MRKAHLLLQCGAGHAGDLIPLNCGTRPIEVHCFLVKVEVLHHERVLIVYWDMCGLHQRERGIIARNNTRIRRPVECMWLH